MTEYIPTIENESNGDEKLIELRYIADTVRARTFETILDADTGHLGGCSSSTELMTALYFGGYLKYDPTNSKDPNRDVVLVRGHEGPLRYTIFSMIGFLEKEELHGYRKFGSRLPGHENMLTTPGVDITPSGSLGMLLSYGTGAAIESKRNGIDNKIVVFLGDGEEQEGNVSEAARNISALCLDNIVVIIDKNEKQLSRETSHSDGKTDISLLWKAYGWKVLEIENGHDLSHITEVYDKAFKENRYGPVCIVAHTVKGVTLPNIETNYSGAHTIGAYDNNLGVKSTISEIRESVVKKGGGSEDDIYNLAKKIAYKNRLNNVETNVEKLHKRIDINIKPESGAQLVPSHKYYYKTLGNILEKLTSDKPNFYFLTADLLKKPLVNELGLEKIGNMFDMGIREQHVMATTHGISTMDPDARITLFMGDAFAYRYIDQLNVVAQGGSKALILAEKAGLSQSTNGSSHQSVGQSLAVSSIPFVEFLEPADVVDFYSILNKFYSDNPGLVYARLHGKKLNNEEIISQEMPRSLGYYSAYEPIINTSAVVVSAGFPLCNAVSAARTLESEQKVGIRVVNIMNPKSLDSKFVDLLPNNVPLLILYNGNTDTLMLPVSKAIAKSQVRPSKICDIGYNLGQTGSLKDLEKHFELDKYSIINKVLELI